MESMLPVIRRVSAGGIRREGCIRFGFWDRAQLALWLAAALLACAAVHAQENRPPEYQLKAAVLFNLAKFVDWPSNTFASTGAPFVVGVVGADPFGALLDNTLRSQTVQGRRTLVRRFAPGEDLRGCQLLFISRSERERLPDILAAVFDAPVLTISETDLFAQHGGMVNLVLQEDMVRFEINLETAEARGLKISSKVVKYARLVRTQNNSTVMKP